MEWVRTEALGQTKLAFDDLVNQLKRRRFKHRRIIIKKVARKEVLSDSRGSAQVCASAGCACTRTEEWRADIAAAAANAGARIKENSFKAFK